MATGEADGLAFFEWSADPTDDPTDPEVWRGCHPALGNTISGLRKTNTLLQRCQVGTADVHHRSSAAQRGELIGCRFGWKRSQYRIEESSLQEFIVSARVRSPRADFSDFRLPRTER